MDSRFGLATPGRGRSINAGGSIGVRGSCGILGFFFSAVVLAVVFATGVVEFAGAQTPAPSVKASGDELDHRLARGVNISNWFAQSDEGYGEGHLAGYFTVHDAQILRDAGFTHVRLPISMEWGFKVGSRGDTYRSALTEKIAMINAAGLAVVVDLHPTEGEKRALKRALLKGGGDRRFVGGWRLLAGALAPMNPDLVLFEIMNEPYPLDAGRWRALQAAAIKAVRTVAPRNTVIANPGGWSDIDEYAAFTPYAHANVIYTAHIYEPLLFTHQGATWTWPLARQITGVDWPIGPDAAADSARRAGLTAEATEQLRDQIADGQFGRDWLLERIDKLARWQQQHGQAIYIGEFGVFRAHAPPAANLRWIQEVRLAFELRGWGWALWDYAGGFGIAQSEARPRVLDDSYLRALGLRERGVTGAP